VFDQSPYECKIEWGQRGAREASERGDIIIIVDVLSFSSTVVTAVNFGAIIYPFPKSLNGQDEAYAEKVGAELILGRAEAARLEKPTLSPITFNQAHANQKYVLCSLNGALCTWVASKVPALLIGSLLNASTVAKVANKLRAKTNANITIIPCGEQWSDVKDGENRLRPSIEDYLGAGSILSKLEGEMSPEAEVCVGAFLNVEGKINELIWECGSGRELRERGFGDDVRHCSQLNVYETVPILHNGYFVDTLKHESIE
jgi:2-phosphosulfolactate phosphatase